MCRSLIVSERTSIGRPYQHRINTAQQATTPSLLIVLLAIDLIN